MRRPALVVGAVVLLSVGYLALDVADVVPGVLTRAPLAPPTPTVAATTGPQPHAAPAGMPLAVTTTTAPLPTRAGLQTALGGLLSDPRLGASPAVVVRDAGTGAMLLDQNAATPHIAASTLKLLAAAAIDSVFPAGATLTTKAVQGATPGRLVLVAGGDTLLAPGAGDPTAVVGRAGLGDLATKTATALRAVGIGAVTLSVDLSYAPGPLVAPTWGASYRPTGVTGAVTMIGLSTQRVVPGRPGPADPAASARSAFASALRTAGVTVAIDSTDAPGDGAAPAGALVYASVTSAPVGDQLALALRDSDDALTETLARQAAYSRGVTGGFAPTAAWMRATLTTLGIDVTGLSAVDASGLSREDVVTARMVSDVIALGTGTQLPTFRATLRQLTIAGLTGSLSGRFDDPRTQVAAGIVRAKTGTLTGVGALAGTLVTAEGRLLTFVVIANAAPSGVGTLRARDALDEFVATLAQCGCRA